MDEVPKYIPTPISWGLPGPRPLTIEEYKRRQQRPKSPPPVPKKPKRKHRAGKKLKMRTEQARLRDLIKICSLSGQHKEARKLYLELKNLKL